MPENIFSSFDISAQGLSVERQRLSAVAKNIANANTTKIEDGKPYQREVVVVHGKSQNTFDKAFENQLQMSGGRAGNIRENSHGNAARILSANTVSDESGERLVHDPSHPDADEDGYVHLPNVNIVTEMVEMIAAQRSFEANTSVVASAKNLAKDSLDI